jgi:hypothetical protein
LVLAVLESHVGAAQALSCEAYALAREHGLRLDDVDNEVLSELLFGATRYLSALVASMLPEGADDADAIAAVAAGHRPRVEPLGTNPRGYPIRLIRTALRRTKKAHRLLTRFDKEKSRVSESITGAGTRLEVALCLLETRARPYGPIDALLDGYREVVRRRRGGGEMTAV